MEYSSTFIGDYLKKWLWQQGGSFSWVKNKMLALGYTKVLRKFPCLTIQEPLWQTHSHIWAGSNPFIATPPTLRDTPGFQQQSLRCPHPSDDLILPQ